MTALTIEVVSDIVCPWCFIGKRHLDKALETWRVEHPEMPVSMRWRPFFLNPDTPEGGEPYRPFLERKFGGSEKLAAIWNRVRDARRGTGIEFAFEKIELRANTLNAHRLIHYAQRIVGATIDPTAGTRSGTANDALIAALVENLFAAQFIEGRNIGDRAVLAAIADESGMNAGEVRSYLDSNEDADEVCADAKEARRMGVTGVPFFIFNQRISAPGAQPPEGLLSAMREAAKIT